jgi:subtilase family serine protease
VTGDRRLLARRAGLALALPLVLGLLTVIAPHAVAAPAAPKTPAYRSCATADEGRFRCMSVWHGTTASAPPSRTQQGEGSGAAAAPKPPSGLHPTNIRSAYDLPLRGKKNQTVAIVDAFDNPNVEQDLAVYRSAFGLSGCTTANGCFRKVDQRGGTRYPEGDPGWGVEISLDVQAVSASCRTCKILLVEADDDSFEAIGAAENTAVRLGATVVSNSYGTDESGAMWDYAKRFYTHPDVAIVASSGDYGFTTASFPAVLQTTWAVGGTRLKKTKSGGWTEDAWEGAGSGCSAYVDKPAVQKGRTVADLSAVADPDNEFSVYDTYGLDEDNGWIAVGGTSLSAPLVAGMIGLAGNAQKVASPTYLYTHRSGLRDVRGGSNGYCGGDYLCTAVKGYDAPTGLGSPRGLTSL